MKDYFLLHSGSRGALFWLLTWHAPWCRDPECSIADFPARAWWFDYERGDHYLLLVVLGVDLTMILNRS